MNSGAGQKVVRVSAKGCTEALAGGVHSFLEEVLKERWRKYRKAVKHCRKDYGEESVHQLRIETRRMLSLLDLMHPFHPAGLQGFEVQFKKLFKGSASLRDTQVQLLYVEKDLKKFPEIRPFKKYLRKREKELRKKFLKKAASGPKPKLKKSIALIQQWFGLWGRRIRQESVDEKKLLDGLKIKNSKVLEAHGSINGSEPETIHRLRIAFKAYRYMVELLEPFLKGVTAKQMTAMRAYQAMMGDIQDVEVLLGAMERFEQKDAGHSFERYRAELERRHEKLIGRFLRTTPAILNLPVSLSRGARNGETVKSKKKKATNRIS